MVHTHFADPSGFSSRTVSSASDLVILGRKVLDVPALAALVSTQRAQLPDGTVLDNLDTLLGSEPGWAGPSRRGRRPTPAGAWSSPCVARSAPTWSPWSARCSGRPTCTRRSTRAATAADTGYEGYGVVHLTDVPAIGGRVTTRWGDASGVQVATAGDDHGGVPVRMGTVLQLSAHTEPLAAQMGRNREVAFVEGSDGTGRQFRWSVVLVQGIPRPSAMWMLFKN